MPEQKPTYPRIIINFPTNIGDAILGLPVIDKLKFNHPLSQINAITSPQTNEFLSRNSNINQTMVFDKRWNALKKLKFALSFFASADLMVDLKNSFFPLISGGKHTSFFRIKDPSLHAKDTYLKLITRFAPEASSNISDFSLTDQERRKWENHKLSNTIFIACASNALQKQYPYKYLSKVITQLKNESTLVILGQERDRDFYQDILKFQGIIDLVGKTAIHEVFYLMKKYCRLLLCVDSSILHIASYLNIPTVALFGQNSPKHYGPWSEKYTVLRNENLPCVPCAKPHCHMNHQCMEIDPERIVAAVQKLSRVICR